MNADILKKLRESKDMLPTWSSAVNLAKSADELKICLACVLRGTLLLRVRNLLIEQGLTASLYLVDFDQKVESLSMDSEFDERFAGYVALRIECNNATVVQLCSCGPDAWLHPFQIGYAQTRGCSEQMRGKADVEKCGSDIFQGNTWKDQYGWYICEWSKDISYENCSDELTAKRIANRLAEMHKRLSESVFGNTRSAGASERIVHP